MPLPEAARSNTLFPSKFHPLSIANVVAAMYSILEQRRIRREMEQLTIFR